MTIDKFVKGILRGIGDEVEAAVQEIAKRHGLTATYGGGSFDDNEFKARIVFRTIAGGGR